MLASSTPNSTLYRQTLNRMGWSMLIFIGLFSTTQGLSATFSVMGESITELGLKNLLNALLGILSTICYMLPFFLTGMIFYAMSGRMRTERPSFEIKLPREFPLLILAGMAMLTAGAYVNSWFCTAIHYTMPADLLLTDQYDDISTVVLYMTVALAPAFAEEFLFRGVFYANLRPYGRTQAILISSLLFALMHQNIGQLFYTFVGGIAMALMYELTGSIWCSVFFHMFNNEMSVLSQVIYYGWGGEASVPYTTILDAILIVLGACSLLLLIVYYKKIGAHTVTGRQSGIYGSRHHAVERFDRPLSGSAVIKGALCPGMIVFTVVTAVLMGITWLALLAMSGGGL